MIAKDGIKIIVYTGIMFVMLLFIRQLMASTILDVLIILCGILFIFHFIFFRDPERIAPDGDSRLISPADGKIIKIDKVFEPHFFQKDVQLISIFMNIFDVHVNRIPISGEVDYFNYQKGKFLVASDDRAMQNNEQAIIGIQSEFGPVLFKQIAGLIARRIVCRLQKGMRVKKGDRFGMIKYSSRVDIFVPDNFQIQVSLNDRVTAGLTIIGEFIR